MRRLAKATTWASLLGLAACVRGAEKAIPEAPGSAKSLEQGNLLLYPTSEPERLLGRAVTLMPGGDWTIADALAPGCEVVVRRRKAAYAAKRTVDLRQLTSFSAGFSQQLGLTARYGADVRAAIDVNNDEVLEADTRGPCGDAIVDRVFVGAGQRRLLRAAEYAAGATAPVAGAQLGGETKGSGAIVDETAWPAGSGYAFGYRKGASVSALEVRVELPTELLPGQDVSATITTSRPAYLVSYYLESSGQAAVLWPSREEPRPRTQAGVPFAWPSPAEKSAGIVVKAALRTSGEPARETLVVYAFENEADFERLKPAIGATAATGAAYAAQLTKALEQVPLSRWGRVERGYVIVPR